MRVTDSMKTLQALSLQARAAERHQTAATRASTGYKISKPSDGVGAFSRAQELKASLSQMQARSAATQLSQGDVDIAEATLASAEDVVSQAQEVATRLGNGTFNASDRATSVAQINTLRESLIGIANSKGSRGYLFAGTKIDTPPFDATGTFQGRDDAIQVEVSKGSYATTNVSGAAAFTAVGGVDLFDALDSLATALQNNDVPGIKSAQDLLRAGHEQVVKARVSAGVISQRLSSVVDASDSAALQLKSALGATVEIDPTQAYSEFMDAQQAYERGIAVTRQLLQMSSQNGG